MPLSYLHIDHCLKVFAEEPATQASAHIKPFHQYVGVRLVLEGGFHPDEITPHPPIRAVKSGNNWWLHAAPDVVTESELTILGGMKSKQVDVAVDKKGVGPVVAVSVKGTCKAYRNLVNRMEEAIGDSTNLHVMYPGLVYGFLHLLRTNRQGTGGLADNDIGIYADGRVARGIERYFAALSEMTGRRLVRNDYTRYESVGLVFVESSGPHIGKVHLDWPPESSPLRVDSFFQRLYEVYDLRFPLRNDTNRILNRIEWMDDSPLLQEITAQSGKPAEDILGYIPRVQG